MTKRAKPKKKPPAIRLKGMVAKGPTSALPPTAPGETEDDRAPALPCLAALVVLEELADKEVLLTQRVHFKAFLAKAREDADIKTILEVEREVGQAIFAHALKMVKTMVGDHIETMGAEIGMTEGQRDKLVAGLAEIRMSNPYEGTET